jgi:hypothetical protein
MTYNNTFISEVNYEKNLDFVYTTGCSNSILGLS